MFLGPKFQKENSNSKNGSFIPFLGGGREGKIDRILDIIDQRYVDTIRTDSIQKRAIGEIIKNLDPHSAYLPPMDAKQLSDDLDGNYVGIGIEYHLLNDTMTVISVLKGGPAENAGLKNGDQILSIDGQQLRPRNNNNEEIRRKIRGRSGTSVQLGVKRHGHKALKTLSVKRGRVTVSSLDAAYFVNAKTAYISISKFGGETVSDVDLALKRMNRQGMQNLIMDLRGNGGGYLTAATALADQFLGEKKLIVYTQGAHEPRTDYFATGEGLFEKGRLILLIDEGSASASEILAGAIQDLDRGLVIGRKSFGKGLVQEQFNFGDGSALNLTVARYYTPLGRSIQRPYTYGRQAYFTQIYTRDSTTQQSTGGQKTYRTASGRLLYGGGGITPDVQVARDTSGYNRFYYNLVRKGALNSFIYGYMVYKSKPQSFNELTQKELGPIEVSVLKEQAALKGIAVSPKQLAEALPRINTQIQAQMAYYFYGKEAYYRILNSTDAVVLTALKQLEAN